jgi:hypothetical protein
VGLRCSGCIGIMNMPSFIVVVLWVWFGVCGVGGALDPGYDSAEFSCGLATRYLPPPKASGVAS